VACGWLVADSDGMTGADEAGGLAGGAGWRWDVALSFSGAQRKYVEQVAETLKARGVRCFYDADEQIELWGRHLAEELPAIYAGQAAVVVVFISAEYAAGDWTRVERRAALGQAVRERREYVLPARFDDAVLPGLGDDVVAVDLRRHAPEQFAALVAAKLASLAAGPGGLRGPAGPAAAGRLLGDVRDPFALEVHRPVQPGDAAAGLPELPGYVRREHDEALAGVVAAAGAGRSGVAVLVGGSSTGKTRACWEALGLDALREAGAADQVAALLARDPAAHAALEDPGRVAFLMDRLREAGAADQVAALLARDPAGHVALEDPSRVGVLLDRLWEAGAADQVAALAARLPMVGMFALFLEQTGRAHQFRFGRETDGTPAASWDWDDLDLSLTPYPGGALPLFRPARAIRRPPRALITDGGPGDSPLYHPVRREFRLTEGAAWRTRGQLGPGGRDQRGFVAGIMVPDLGSGLTIQVPGCPGPVVPACWSGRRWGTGGRRCPPGRLADWFDAGQQAELAEHEQVVPAGGMLDELAARDAVDVDLVGLEGPAGGRHGPHDPGRADSGRELAQVGAPQQDAEHHLIVVDDLLLDFITQVGKRGPPCRDDVPHRRLAAWPPDAEVGELVIDQVLDS